MTTNEEQAELFGQQIGEAAARLWLLARGFIEQMTPIIDGDPIGDDACCRFCEMPQRYVLEGQAHEPDCAWVEARRRLGRPVPVPVLAPEPVPAGHPRFAGRKIDDRTLVLDDRSGGSDPERRGRMVSLPVRLPDPVVVREWDGLRASRVRQEVIPFLDVGGFRVEGRRDEIDQLRSLLAAAWSEPSPDPEPVPEPAPVGLHPDRVAGMSDQYLAALALHASDPDERAAAAAELNVRGYSSVVTQTPLGEFLLRPAGGGPTKVTPVVSDADQRRDAQPAAVHTIPRFTVRYGGAGLEILDTRTARTTTLSALAVWRPEFTGGDVSIQFFHRDTHAPIHAVGAPWPAIADLVEALRTANVPTFNL